MQAVNVIFALVAVLALIAVVALLVRRFANSRLGANTNRGRMPRLAVIDAAAVDGRRRLVLVRRDNVEHLLMIGGPSDIVVEPNIVRATARSDQLPQRPPSAEPPPPRIAPLPDAATWQEAEERHPEPQMPEPPPRPARPSFAEELRRPALPERRGDRAESSTGFAPEPMGGRGEPRPEPRIEPRVEPRSEPLPPRMPRGEPLMPRAPRQAEPPKAPPLRPERAGPPPPPPPPPPPASPPPQAASADQNLADMAQRLEAALRRPAGSADAPPVAPEPPQQPPQPPQPPSRASRGEPPVPPAPSAPTPSPKSSFENLEDEMASLLGRPKSSSS